MASRQGLRPETRAVRLGGAPTESRDPQSQRRGRGVTARLPAGHPGLDPLGTEHQPRLPLRPGPGATAGRGWQRSAQASALLPAQTRPQGARSSAKTL